MDKVSVIITSYKRPDTLRRAILSVLGQGYPNIELIVVNDNGLDSPYNVPTRQVVEKLSYYYNNVIYVEHHENKNGAAARNSGIRVATGDYITFLDDDDIFLPHRISKLVSAMKKDEDVSCVYSGVGFIQDTDVVDVLIPQCFSDHVYQLLRQNSFFGTGSNFLCKTELVRSVGGFDELFKRHQDIEFLIRYLSRFPKIQEVSEVLVIKTLDSKINFPSATDFDLVKSHFFSRFDSLIGNYPSSIQREIRKENVRQFVTVAAMNSEWPASAINRFKSIDPKAMPIDVGKSALKWLILQLPGVTVLRRNLAIIRTRRKHPELVSLLRKSIIGVDSTFG